MGTLIWSRVILVVLGIALIVLGFLDYHVQVGAIVVGAIFLGLLSFEQLAGLLAPRRRPTKD